jgi:hypothetical protein
MTGGLSRAGRGALSGAALALAIAFVYAPVVHHPFVVLDDKAFVVENAIVNDGLTGEGVRRAFSESHSGNWVPLSWLSHMIDVELFGLEAGGHHAVNVALHVGATVLLLGAFLHMTGAWAPSAFVAAVFALHPLHVESVAWIAERRDVLSGFFFALALFIYPRWVAAAERGRALGLALLATAALGLLAKPMLVTLPFVLLLLDLWPLRRLDPGATGLAGQVLPLLREKLPLFALVALAALATVVTQSGAGAVASLAQLPLEARVANAAWSGVAYLGKTLWPSGLAVFYPFDASPPLARTAAALALLIALSAAAAWQARRRPWLLVGWLWYLGMLVPVLGLVQVGSQAMADRYTYLPLIGLSVALGWSAQELARSPRLRPWVIGVVCIWLVVCTALARTQVGTWRDSVVLFEHARATVGDHPLVLVNLGEAYDDAGRNEEAIAAYRAGLAGFPHARGAQMRLGILLSRSGRNAEAVTELERAVRIDPEAIGARTALARLALRAGDDEAARELLEAELERAPDAAEALFLRAELGTVAGEPEAAARDFATALALDPRLAEEPALDRDARVTLALAEALAAAGQRAAAHEQARRALSLARLSGDEAQARAAAAWLAAFEGR